MNPDSRNWSLWRTFLAILREGSLTGAAEALGMSHPTVRRHLDELEASIGSPLFGRSQAGLVATELAHELRRPAEAMEAAAETLVRTATSQAAAVAGTVRITASEIMGSEVLPAMLSQLRDRHAGLNFEMRLSNEVDDVMQLEADIAIRMVQPEHGDLVAVRAGDIMLGLFAHRRWLEAYGRPKSLDALVRSRQLIGQDRQTAIIHALAALGIDAGRGDFCFRSDSDVAQLAALRAGFGVGITQLPLAKRDRHLVRILPAWKTSIGVWVVTHPNLRKIARIEVTAKALRDELIAYARL